MKKLNKFAINILIIIVIGIFVFIATLSTNFKDITQTLKNLKIHWLYFAIFLTFLWQFLIGVILARLTRFLYAPYKYRQGFFNALIASFFHGITPSSSGGQFAQTYVFKKQGVDPSTSICVLWLDFILYQTTLCVTTLILIVVKYSYFKYTYDNWFHLIIIGFLINSVIIVGLYAIARFEKFHIWISTKGVKLAKKLRIIKNEETAKQNLEKRVYQFQNELKKIVGNWSLIIEVVILNVLRLFVYYAIPFVIFLSLDLKVNLDIFITSITITAFVSMLSSFVPLPGGAGGTESLFILMFSHLFSLGEVQTNMILWRFITYYLLMIFGAVCFAYVKIKDK